ncbi:hypothetical protein ACFYUJ_27500 [Streptomyces sp. NPDC004520]|uniref:hypothetical protein n=1 Tax=Streptomyces sp. NPDC004520 TaxID=3364702 RepID=UPI0036883235
MSTDQPQGRAAEELTDLANDAGLTVPGSRGLGGVVGFPIGSVSLTVVVRVVQPRVLVRLGAQTRPPGEIVVGVELHRPCEPLLGFAFGEAALRKRPLRLLRS